MQAYQETVDFEELSVYDERTVTVRMFNATPLPLDFVWNFHPLPLPLVPPTRLRTHPVAPLQGALLPPPGDALTTAFPYSISPASTRRSPPARPPNSTSRSRRRCAS